MGWRNRSNEWASDETDSRRQKTCTASEDEERKSILCRLFSRPVLPPNSPELLALRACPEFRRRLRRSLSSPRLAGASGLPAKACASSSGSSLSGNQMLAQSISPSVLQSSFPQLRENNAAYQRSRVSDRPLRDSVSTGGRRVD